VFAGVLFLGCLVSAIFKFRETVKVQRKKTTNLVFNVLLFFRGHFVSYCLFFVPTFVFLKIYKMKDTFPLEYLYKKKTMTITKCLPSLFITSPLLGKPFGTTSSC